MNCSAGDSAAYERRGAASDDIVIVSALRTPITKVCHQAQVQLVQSAWLASTDSPGTSWLSALLQFMLLSSKNVYSSFDWLDFPS